MRRYTAFIVVLSRRAQTKNMLNNLKIQGKMDVTSFYNHAAFTKNVKEGCEIVNNTKCGIETQLYKVGDIIRATNCSPYNFKRAKVVEVYKENGYYRYVCEIGNFERICRGKDIELI